MANINLRPWREELRQKKNQDFDKTIFVVLLFAGLIWFQVSSWYEGEINNQQSRNQLLKDGMVELDQKIKTIQTLTEKREQLIERLRLIQDLQGNRPVIVRVFDELVNKLPEELYFTNLKASSNTLEMTGKAKNNGRVSELLRNFDESEWFENPDLSNITASKTSYNTFTLKVTQTTPKAEEAQQ